MDANTGGLPAVLRVLPVAAALVLGGCGTDLPAIDVEKLTLVAAPDANNDFPVAVDLVLVMEEEVLPTVGGMGAGQWFKDRTQLGLAYPTGLIVRSFEVVPFQTLTYELQGDEDDAVGAFVFARFNAPGMHRARIDRLSSVTVRLNKTTFAIEAGG